MSTMTPFEAGCLVVAILIGSLALTADIEAWPKWKAGALLAAICLLLFLALASNVART